MVGGVSQRQQYTLKKMLFMVHCDFEKGSQNQHFQSTLFAFKINIFKVLLWVSKSTFSKYSFSRKGGGHKKSAMCTLLIMLTILDNP